MPVVPTDEVMERAFALRHGAGAFDGPDDPTRRSARDRRNSFEAKRLTNPPPFPAERHDHLSAVSRGRSAPGNHIILDDIRAWLT